MIFAANYRPLDDLNHQRLIWNQTRSRKWQPSLTVESNCAWWTHTVNSSPLDKMAAISQTIFSDAYSWMKHFVFWLKFHRSLFVRIQLTITSIGLDNGLALKRRQAIIWTNADPVYRRKYTALGGDELWNIRPLIFNTFICTIRFTTGRNLIGIFIIYFIRTNLNNIRHCSLDYNDASSNINKNNVSKLGSKIILD